MIIYFDEDMHDSIEFTEKLQYGSMEVMAEMEDCESYFFSRGDGIKLAKHLIKAFNIDKSELEDE